MALSAPLIFFIISNFGVWALGDLYSKDLNGLFQCYIIALPFLKNSYAGTIIFMLAYFLILQFINFSNFKIYSENIKL